MLLTVPLWLEITEIVLSLLLDGAVVAIAVVSALYAYRAYKHQKDRSKKDAACELAQYYADVILQEYRAIHDVFCSIGYDSLIKEIISLNDISKFDFPELTKLTKDKKQTPDVFAKKIDNADPLIILECKSRNTENLVEREKIQKYIAYFNSLPADQQAKEGRYLVYTFRHDIATLMNHLEWFCMKCSYGLAEEELIYRSLHQTFLSIVCQMYPFISNSNENIEEKFFTNVIWLYGQWHDRVVDIKKIAEEKKKEYERQLEGLCNSTPLD